MKTQGSKFNAYMRLMRLDKPIGSLLLLWPTLWALWLAGQGAAPRMWIVAIFVIGTVLMRSAGCVINDWADRDFDGHVQRTNRRPLITGEVTSKEALTLAAALAAVSFLLVLPLNGLVIQLSFAALVLAASYPFFKRFFAIPQAYLGIAFGFGIPMAYAALLGNVPTEAWWMLLGNVFWCVAYDTEYAMVDRPDDLKIGIKTSAITFGRFDVLAVMLCYAVFFAIMASLGVVLHRGGLYFLGLVLAAVMAGYHFTLIRERDRSLCFRAFLHNNWLGAAVFAGILADSLIHI